MGGFYYLYVVINGIKVFVKNGVVGMKVMGFDYGIIGFEVLVFYVGFFVVGVEIFIDGC